jgi:hypothetical protein
MTNKLIERLAEEVDLLGDFTPTKVPGHYAGTISTDTIEKFALRLIEECKWALWTEECRNSYLAAEDHARDCGKINEHFDLL